MKNMRFNEKLILVSIIFSLVLMSNISEVFAVASISLNPSSGKIGDSVTVSGSGFTGSQQVIHNTSGASPPPSTFGNVYTQQFTGLTVGANITQLGYKLATNGVTGLQTQTAGIVVNTQTAIAGNVYALELSGIPSNATLSKVGLDVASNGTQTQTMYNAVLVNTSTCPCGNVYAEQYTGLPSDGFGVITQVGLNVNTAAGNIRIKFYNDVSNAPTSLISEAGPFAVTGTGMQLFSVSVNVPASGTMWVGVEGDSGSLAFNSHNTQQFGSVRVVHTYGTGPNPFGSGLAATTIDQEVIYHDTQTPHVRIKLYNDNGANAPSSLIAESGPLLIGNNGKQNFTMNAQVPFNGTMFVGVETDSTSVSFNSHNTSLLNAVRIPHTFGAGPNPFGSGIASTTIWTQITFTDMQNHHFRIKLYNDNNNTPKSLITEAGPYAIPLGVTGLENFTISAKVPANGTVWTAIETDSDTTSFISSNTNLFNALRVVHSYGAGPDPFGSGFAADSLYVALTYSQKPLQMKWDGTTLTTNPIPITETTGGSFSGVTFSVPSSTGGSHTVNASEVGGTFATANFIITPYTVSLKPLLHDGVTPITSGKLIVTQNGVTIGTGNTNSSGYATVSNISGGTYNFTIMDDKNFAVYKELNTVVSGNIAKNVSTFDTPFNCVSSLIGYQSDVILRINDTDGTHITNISTPTCANQNQISFNMTFAGNGQSGNTFSSSMITTAGTQLFASNPSSFTVSGTSVPTTFTGGNNIVSNSFTIGSGLATTVKNFIITLTATHGTGSATQSGGQNYFTTNSTCFAGVYDPKSSTCVFGPINITIPNVTINTNPNQQSNDNIGISCDGTGALTVTSVNLGSNPLGIQIGQLPVTVNCGNPTPTQCPTGATLTNGVCVAPLTCPVGSQTQNGICTGQLTCPDGTTLQNSQCIAPATCPVGSVMVNGQCVNNGIPIILPPTPSPCDITNPLSCITSTTQSQDVVVTATTSDGRVVSSTTTLTKVLNPELNNVSLVIILLIIAAIIGGIIYRYLTRKPKKQNGSRHGKSKKIEDFNKSIRKS